MHENSAVGTVRLAPPPKKRHQKQGGLHFTLGACGPARARPGSGRGTKTPRSAQWIRAFDDGVDARKRGTKKARFAHYIWRPCPKRGTKTARFAMHLTPLPKKRRTKKRLLAYRPIEKRFCLRSWVVWGGSLALQQHRGTSACTAITRSTTLLLVVVDERSRP